MIHAQHLLVDPLDATPECLLPIAWTTNVAHQHATRAYSIYESKQPEDASQVLQKCDYPMSITKSVLIDLRVAALSCRAIFPRFLRTSEQLQLVLRLL